MEFVKDPNCTRAAIAAGYSEKSAAKIGSQTLAIPAVKAEIDAIRAQLDAPALERYQITNERVLQQAAYGSFFDPAGLFHKDGSPKSMDEMDYATRCQIVGIEVMEKWSGSGKERVFVGNVLRYKLADRRGYVDMLMRHLGEYKKDNEQAGHAAVGALGELVAQMRGSSVPVVKELPGAA